jgi:orotidine-5'-phosphate decarboxylase
MVPSQASHSPTLTPHARLMVALDLPDVAAARQMVARLGPSVGVYKIGMQLLFSGGLDLAAELRAAGQQVFLDAKLLDIEQTIRGASASIARLGVAFLTIHGYGSVARAAVAGRGTSRWPKILAVTALTSLDAADLAEMGLSVPVEDLVLRRARAARDAGCDGVVCSGQEAAAVRAACGPDFLIVTPGIRPAGEASDEQKRAVTPMEAIRAGADYLVVGRPILRAPDPRAAAEAIIDEIAAALS